MTTLILVNKQEPTSHENFGSAFLSFDTKKEVKTPQWWVNNSPQMRTEILKPMAEKVGVTSADVIVKSSSGKKERVSIWTLDDFAILNFYNSAHDSRHENKTFLPKYLVEQMRAKMAEKSIKEYSESSEDSDSDSKGGFFSKLFKRKD